MRNQILYNLTIKIEKPSEATFIEYVKDKFFKEIIAQGIVNDIQLNRLILDEKDGDSTYAVHFMFPDVNIFNDKKLTVLGLFLNLIDKQFKGKYVYFGTMMEVLFYCKAV